MPEWAWLQVQVELKPNYSWLVQLRFLSLFRPGLLEFVCLQVFQILFQSAWLLMQWWYSDFLKCMPEHGLHAEWWQYGAVYIGGKLTVKSVPTLPLHLACQDFAWAWNQCYSSSSIPAAMAYFAAYDHKKRLNSPLSCGLCSHLNLLNWMQIWIRAVVLKAHTPALKLGSGQGCISWVTTMLAPVFL